MSYPTTARVFYRYQFKRSDMTEWSDELDLHYPKDRANRAPEKLHPSDKVEALNLLREVAEQWVPGTSFRLNTHTHTVEEGPVIEQEKKHAA